MVDVSVMQNFLVALALGALIGLEREYARYRQRGYEFAGIRTFPLISLFGALCAYLGDSVSIWILLIGMMIIGMLTVIAYFTINKRMPQDVGATTEVAGILTFLIGALSYYQEITFAVILAVTIAVILFARSILHSFAKKIQKQEIADTLKFAVVAFVILPFLPNKGYGPFEVFYPFLIWLIVVFISGISFAGYIIMKWFGERGLRIAALLGGLVSSTALTTSFAERSMRQRTLHQTLALGVILANGMMFVRILVEVFVLNRDLFLVIVLPITILTFLTAVFAYYLWKQSKVIKEKVSELGSPFTLGPALKFGVYFAIVLALIKLAEVYFSAKGVYAVSFLSGFADVDAVIVSLSQLANDSLSQETARNGIIVAALTNIAAKGGIAYWLGSKEFSKIVVGSFGIIIAVGLLLMVVL